MKKNWIQITTLCLCIILLIVTFRQNQKLDDYQQQLQRQIDHLSLEINQETQNLSNHFDQKLSEANRIVSNYTLIPKSIDKENHVLITDVSVFLKEWHEESEMTLLGKVGNQNISVNMENESNAKFVGQLSLPLDNNSEIFLSALISGNGMTKQEELGSWSDISMLLPLSSSGGGWSGPEYKDGLLSSQFTIAIEYQKEPVIISNPVFKTFKNGNLVQTAAGIVDSAMSGDHYVSYTIDTENNIWDIKCEQGDTIEIHFCCEDEYGLGYDFLFKKWVIAEEINELEVSENNLTLYWP